MCREPFRMRAGTITFQFSLCRRPPVLFLLSPFSFDFLSFVVALLYFLTLFHRPPVLVLPLSLPHVLFLPLLSLSCTFEPFVTALLYFSAKSASNYFLSLQNGSFSENGDYNSDSTFAALFNLAFRMLILERQR